MCEHLEVMSCGVAVHDGRHRCRCRFVSFNEGDVGHLRKIEQNADSGEETGLRRFDRRGWNDTSMPHLTIQKILVNNLPVLGVQVLTSLHK